MTERINRAEIDKIIDSINNRTPAQTRRVRLKFFLWNFTISTTKFIKRLFDTVIAFAALIFLMPCFIALGIAIKIESPGPVIFRQIRVGKNGRNFTFYKFRSMRQGADAEKAQLAALNESKDGVIFKMHDDPRITKIGKFIRKFSIDELPQLYNVLIGDMSLVGPRPPTVNEVALYTLEERKRLHVIPGITCLWQISGRSDIPFQQQVILDKEYISSHGVWKDLKILLKTIPAVFTGRGAY